MNDLISDMLTRIRNASALKKPWVKVGFSNVCLSLAKIMKENGYLKEVKKISQEGKHFINLYLNSGPGQRHLKGLKRVSKPGQRIYKKPKELQPVRQGHGIGVVSTSQGLMTYKEARSKNVGGEVICEIW